MLYRGCVFLPKVDGSGSLLVWGAAGLLLGAAKGWFVLSTSATRAFGYIDRRPECDWFWLSIQPIFYVLIPLMIGFGVFVRKTFGESTPGLVAALYIAVSVALLIGSWRATLKRE